VVEEEAAVQRENATRQSSEPHSQPLSAAMSQRVSSQFRSVVLYSKRPAAPAARCQTRREPQKSLTWLARMSFSLGLCCAKQNCQLGVAAAGVADSSTAPVRGRSVLALP